MMYRCRCGGHVEQPHGSIEVFTNQGEASIQLCESCTVEIVRFVNNQDTRRVIMPTDNPQALELVVDDDDVDDLSIPIVSEDGQVSEDWLRELKRPA